MIARSVTDTRSLDENNNGRIDAGIIEDTLQNITDNGAYTNNSITVGGLTILNPSSPADSQLCINGICFDETDLLAGDDTSFSSASLGAGVFTVWGGESGCPAGSEVVYQGKICYAYPSSGGGVGNIFCYNGEPSGSSFQCGDKCYVCRASSSIGSKIAKGSTVLYFGNFKISYQEAKSLGRAGIDSLCAANVPAYLNGKLTEIHAFVSYSDSDDVFDMLDSDPDNDGIVKGYYFTSQGIYLFTSKLNYFHELYSSWYDFFKNNVDLLKDPLSLSFDISPIYFMEGGTEFSEDSNQDFIHPLIRLNTMECYYLKYEPSCLDPYDYRAKCGNCDDTYEYVRAYWKIYTAAEMIYFKDMLIDVTCGFCTNPIYSSYTYTDKLNVMCIGRWVG